MTEKYCQICKGDTDEGLICLTHHKKALNLAEEHHKKEVIQLQKIIGSSWLEIDKLEAENKELQKEYDIWHPVRSVEVSLDKLKKETRKAYPSSRKERA